MAEYTVTLKEIVETSTQPLINPTTVLYDKEHFETLFVKHFLFREIAFPTPEQFVWKLNAYVSERAQSYNKMFTSQLMEIDPFVTDYMVQYSNGKQNVAEFKKDNRAEFTSRDSTYVSDTANDKTENYTDNDESKHYKENTGVELKARLNSESENKNNRQNTVTDLTHKETSTENTDYSGTTKTDTDKTTNKDYTHNQTGRNWTENGSSSGHKLDVHSDTPQAMLFNTPPHYAGTGRMHLEGKTSNPETEYPKHYSENSPSAIDSADLGFNGGDSPWFNYASDANNNIAHDSYSKSGTETFNQSDATKETSDENQNKTENYSKEVDVTKNYTENTNQYVNGSDSRSLNSNEHIKNDNKAQENFKETANSNYELGTNSTSKRADNTNTKNDSTSKRIQDNKQETNNSNESIRKGRTMKSPSKLLDEYRQTLTFNADLWMFGELEPLFMQLF